MIGPAYRLALRSGGRELSLRREELLAMPQHTAPLPIACVEGWTTTQEWTGVRLARPRAVGRAPTLGQRARALAAAARRAARGVR